MSNKPKPTLDEILLGLPGSATLNPDILYAKQQIIDAIMDIIGEDEESRSSHENYQDGLEAECLTCGYFLTFEDYDIDCRCKDRNKLKAEQRNKLNEWSNK